MGESTEIAWTDHSFNPWWGCQRVSPGCENCYAETFSKRVGHGVRLPTIWGPPATADRKFFGDAHWAEPLKWNRKAAKDGVRRRVFCASMADVFEDRPNPKPGYFYDDRLRKERARLWALIHQTPSLDWLLLTKRPENAERLAFQAFADAFALATHDDVPATHWMPNIWLGTTVEDQKRADERIPHLLAVPARVRFLSCEPLLEHVRLDRIPYFGTATDILRGWDPPERGIHWVIVGGESGASARSFDVGWARSIREHCAMARIACFVKQMGSRPIDEFGSVPLRDHKGGDWTEWPEDLRVREFPTPR